MLTIGVKCIASILYMNIVINIRTSNSGEILLSRLLKTNTPVSQYSYCGNDILKGIIHLLINEYYRIAQNFDSGKV